jgi:hypothetical protein
MPSGFGRWVHQGCLEREMKLMDLCRLGGLSESTLRKALSGCRGDTPTLREAIERIFQDVDKSKGGDVPEPVRTIDDRARQSLVAWARS